MLEIAQRVVSNTTPIIALSVIGRLNLLRDLYAEVLIPPAVYSEVMAGGARRAGTTELRRAAWIQTIPLQNPRRADLLVDLDRGEAAVFPHEIPEPDLDHGALGGFAVQ